MSPFFAHNDQGGALESNSDSPDHVSAVMSIVHSRETLHSRIDAMCQHLTCLYASSPTVAASCPPRVLTQAKHSGRKWILDVFSSSSTASKLAEKYAMLLWGVLEVKALQTATQAIVCAAVAASNAATACSKDLLCCCGQYLQLLNSGKTNALVAPVLKMCSTCFSCMPHDSMDGGRELHEVLMGSGTSLLHSAAQIILNTGADTNKQQRRHNVTRRIDEAISSLCKQPALLQHAVQELLSAPSQQGLAQLVGEQSEQCKSDQMVKADEATDPQLPHSYLDNLLFTPWEWLEQAANAVTLQPWQQAMVECLPQHACWLVGLCTTASTNQSRREGPSGRLKKMRGGADAKQAQAESWNAFLALLHRSTLTVQRILHCGKDSQKKRPKSSNKQPKQKLCTASALQSALQVCAMAVRACGEHKVYSPTVDLTGQQKAALKQFLQLILGLHDHQGTQHSALVRGKAAVLAEVTALEHSLVTADVKLSIQLVWATGAFDDASEDAQGQHQHSTSSSIVGCTLMCKSIEAFSSLRNLQSLLSSLFSSIVDDCPTHIEGILLSEQLHDALASAAQRAPAAQACMFVDAAASALASTAGSSPTAGQLRCICSVAATVLSSVHAGQAVVQVAGMVQACTRLVQSMQAVLDACCEKRCKNSPTEAQAGISSFLHFLPLLRLQAVTYHLHSNCAANDPSIPHEPPCIRLPAHALQDIRTSGAYIPQNAGSVKAVASITSFTCCQASELLQSCPDGKAHPLVSTLISMGASAIVNAAQMPLQSLRDAYLGCAACCAHLVLLYEDVLTHAQFSLSCELHHEEQPVDTQAGAVKSADAAMALGHVSTFAALMFVSTSPAAQKHACELKDSCSAAAAELGDATSVAVQRMLLPCMTTCVAKAPAELREHVAGACIDACLAPSIVRKDSPPQRFSEAADVSCSEQPSGNNLNTVDAPPAASAHLKVLGSMSSDTSLIEALACKGNALQQELHDTAKKSTGQICGDSSELAKAATACMRACVLADDADTSALWDQLHSFLSTHADTIKVSEPAPASKVPDGEQVAAAIQRLLQFSALTASLVMTGPDTPLFSQQLISQSIVASLVSAASCAVLLHCAGCHAERDMSIELVSSCLSWLAEACLAGWVLELSGAPGVLAAWLAACLHMSTSIAEPRPTPIRSVWMVCQLRTADLLSHLAAQSVQIEDSKKHMKRLLKRIHPQLPDATGRKRKQCDLEEAGDAVDKSACVPLTVLPLLSGVMRAVKSACTQVGEDGSVQPGVSTVLRAVTRMCGDMQQQQHCSSSRAADLGEGKGAKDRVSPCLGQLQVVRAQSACCGHASKADDHSLMQALQVNIDCTMAVIASAGSTHTLHVADGGVMLQLLSSAEALLNHMVTCQHSDAAEGAMQVQLLCLACLEAEVSTATIWPMQSPTFQAGSLVLQRALEACGKRHAHSTLQRVLGLLHGRPHCGAGPLYTGLTAILLLLESGSPVLRRVLKKDALTVFHTVLTSLHANSIVTAEQQNSQQRLQVHAINSLALRCMESMVAQKGQFRDIGPVLHQVSACVGASTDTLLSHVQAVNRAASPVPVEGAVQIIGGCCSLITALVRHRSEAAEAVIVGVPWFSRQWIDCLCCLATASGVEEMRRRELVNTAAQAVGSMWEAAAACDACKGYMPLLVLEFLRGRCAGAPGIDAMLGGALQLIGALTDSQLQQAHREASRQDESGLAAHFLAELKAEFGKRFKYTGKV